MYPELLKIGPITLNSYGVMITMGFLVSGYLMQGELKRINLDKNFAWKIILAALIGGFLGSKIYFLIKHQYLLQEEFWGNIFSVSGLIWHGGLVGGFLAITILVWIYKYDYLQIYDIIGPFLLLGQSFGRMGCLLAGDGCYGPPTDLPWGMKFPDGAVPTLDNLQLQELFAMMYPGSPIPADIAVHPTPLYHIFLLMLFFSILWMLRKRSLKTGAIWGLYLVCVGLERFITDFWRLTSKHILGIFSEAQLVSIILMMIGSLLLIYIYQPLHRRD